MSGEQKKRGERQTEGEQQAHPPLPENPYRRFYTRTPSFEELIRKVREGEKKEK